MFKKTFFQGRLITLKNPVKDNYDVKVINELNKKVNDPDLYQEHLFEAEMKEMEDLDNK